MSSAESGTRQIEIGGYPFSVEVAETPEQKARGMMHRKYMPNGTGMLFKMGGGPARFHMKNTYIPLDILYLDASGVIIKKDGMRPHVGKSHCDGDVHHVIELPANTCDELAIKVGDQLNLNESSRMLKEDYEDIVKVGVRLRVNLRRRNLMDILTDIRGLPNVITVSQEGQLQTAPEGKNMANVSIGFNDDARFDVPDMESGLLKIDGVDMVMVRSYNDQKYDPKALYGSKNESVLRDIVRESLRSSWENPQKISDIVYRPWSKKFYEQVRQIKQRVHENASDLDWFEREMLSTDIGEFGLYEGSRVPLDIPIPAELVEAEYQGKKVELDKPKRGGTAKFYVYVRDPKTKNVKKVPFGAEGMSVGIEDPERVKSFVARHKCKSKEKEDKTKPGYWSCRLPRYWKSLGLKKTSKQWW